jgi:hypothetical protein
MRFLWTCCGLTRASHRRPRHVRRALVAGLLAAMSCALVPAVAAGDTPLTATGGGTVLVVGFPNIIASFGLNARQTSLTGEAVGRITYDELTSVAGRHVDVPVQFMDATSSVTPGPNVTGGVATLAGDCTAQGAACPSGFQSVRVYVEDNADSGAGSDVFQISFCTGPAAPAPVGCSVPQGGILRSGDIQVQ